MKILSLEQPQANFLPEGTAPKQKDFTSMSALQGKDYGKTKMKSATPTCEALGQLGQDEPASG